MDDIEIFVRDVGVTKVAIHRKLETGKNLDVVTGVDLMKNENVEKLMRYIDRHLVIVGGPPCTSFSKLSKMNRCNSGGRAES